MVFSVTTVTFTMTFLRNRWTNVVMDDGRVRPLAITMPFLVINL